MALTKSFRFPRAVWLLGWVSLNRLATEAIYLLLTFFLIEFGLIWNAIGAAMAFGVGAGLALVATALLWAVV